MPSTPYCGRFAPSPTGPLHLGSMLAAFGSWLLARHAGGRWLVRIEDVDAPREVPGASAAQLATLAAFGLHPDAPVQYQSRRHALYQHAAEQLLQQGKAFFCHCSRADLANQHGIHRQCVARPPRPQPAIRLRVADGSHIAFNDGLQGRMEQAVDRDVGDFVLLRADGCWAYQLAVVVDDAAQGISNVVRGADLMDSTPRQILLQRALGLPAALPAPAAAAGCAGPQVVQVTGCTAGGRRCPAAGAALAVAGVGPAHHRTGSSEHAAGAAGTRRCRLPAPALAARVDHDDRVKGTASPASPKHRACGPGLRTAGAFT